MLVPSVKNLIFDLGGVILDLSINHTLESFSRMAGMPVERTMELFHSAPGFLQYEKGEIDDSTFRDFLRETYAFSADDAAIDACWNAMLRGIPRVKLELLQKLQQEFTVLLLSNTNTIHLRYINEVLLPSTSSGTNLDIYFHKAYYSHKMRKRKPDADIFEQVLEENRLVPEQTLFLDDSALNVEGARSLGIRTLHVTSPNLILDYFHA